MSASSAAEGPDPKTSGLREVGDDSASWSLSTAKPGNGIEQLRDDS